VVRITVQRGQRGSAGDVLASLCGHSVKPRGLVTGLGTVTAGALAAAVATMAVVALALAGGGSGVRGGARTATPAVPIPAGGIPRWGAGPDPIEAANRSPLRCVRVVIAAGDPSYGRAELDRAANCWRGAAWVTTILHRVDGTWRPVLVEDGDACGAAASLPRVVRTELRVCLPGAPPVPAPRPAPERNHH
jgi:hypothetical protein